MSQVKTSNHLTEQTPNRNQCRAEFVCTRVLSRASKPGPSQVGAISKAQKSKRTSKCQSIGEFGTFYEKKMKSLTMPKKLKGRILWDFSTSILLQYSKKIEREPFSGKNEKSHSAEKNLKGEPFGLVRYCKLRGKPFWFSSLGQQVQFGVFSKLCRTFGVELFWSLQVYREKILKNTDESHDYSRLLSLEKRRLKMPKRAKRSHD